MKMWINPREMKQALYAAYKARAGDVVSLEEMERRAEICRECDHLQVPKNLKERLALKLSHGKLVCGICHCGIDLIVKTKEAYLGDKSQEQYDSRPPECWYPNFDPEKRYKPPPQAHVGRGCCGG